jgi:hypothetical protein
LLYIWARNKTYIDLLKESKFFTTWTNLVLVLLHFLFLHWIFISPIIFIFKIVIVNFNKKNFFNVYKRTITRACPNQQTKFDAPTITIKKLQAWWRKQAYFNYLFCLFNCVILLLYFCYQIFCWEISNLFSITATLFFTLVTAQRETYTFKQA